jgi:Ca2+-binding RTX toxin-like protein
VDGDDVREPLWGRTPGTVVVKVPIDDYITSNTGICKYRVIVQGGNGKRASERTSQPARIAKCNVVGVVDLSILRERVTGEAAAIDLPRAGITFTGDERAELIFGTPFDDVLNGGGGGDVLVAFSGDDVLLGGVDESRDYLHGGNGTLHRRAAARRLTRALAHRR